MTKSLVISDNVNCTCIIIDYYIIMLGIISCYTHGNCSYIPACMVFFCTHLTKCVNFDDQVKILDSGSQRRHVDAKISFLTLPLQHHLMKIL